MEIRKAGFEDLDMLVDNRLEFVTSIRKIENIEQLRQDTKNYLSKHLNGDSLLYYICLDDNKIVSSCLLCIYDTIPTPSSLNGRRGLLLNVYTIEAYRRRGLASKVITQTIAEAKKREVSKIQLDYTDDGYPLYKSLGFKKLEREMELKL